MCVFGKVEEFVDVVELDGLWAAAGDVGSVEDVLVVVVDVDDPSTCAKFVAGCVFKGEGVFIVMGGSLWVLGVGGVVVGGVPNSITGVDEG